MDELGTLVGNELNLIIYKIVMAIKAVTNQESEIIGYTLFCGDDIIRIVADNLVEVGYLLNWNHRIGLIKRY